MSNQDSGAKIDGVDVNQVCVRERKRENERMRGRERKRGAARGNVLDMGGGGGEKERT